MKVAYFDVSGYACKSRGIPDAISMTFKDDTRIHRSEVFKQMYEYADNVWLVDKHGVSYILKNHQVKRPKYKRIDHQCRYLEIALKAQSWFVEGKTH